jgi:hypothetical protein
MELEMMWASWSWVKTFLLASSRTALASSMMLLKAKRLAKT